MNNGVINLDNITDRQKIWLSQISYLNINEQGRNQILNGGINLYQLKDYLVDPNKTFVGNAWIGEKNFNLVASKLTGEEKLPTQLDVLNSLISCGLGNLKITNVSDYQKVASSGFQAMTFQDTFGNTGISYRGSDFNFSEGGIRDWVEADFLEYFKNDSAQRIEALKYFNDNKSQMGNNYLYGHSLGGNLTSHVYAENYNEINEAFTINGNPINQKLLDTKEKIAAFNDSKKYNCNIVCGDIVGHFKSFELYEDNVNYIRNNETMKMTAISSHLVQASTFDSSGNFIKADKEEMKQKMGIVKGAFMEFSKTVREVLNKFETKFETNKEMFKEYKESLLGSFRKKFDELGIKDEDMIKEDFKAKATQAEQEEIEKIKNQLMQTKIQTDLSNEQNQVYDEFQAKTR